MRVVGFRSERELISNLYETSTLGNPDARPYESAKISIVKMAIAAIKPTQYYAVEELIGYQQRLRAKVALFGEDTLSMQYGGIDVEREDGEIQTMMPPIVEKSREGVLLLDGTHRAMLAKRVGEKALMRVVLVENIPEKFDIAQRRLPNDWDEITMFSSVEELKKARKEGFAHRRVGYGASPDDLYRDFSKFTKRSKDVRK